MSAPTIQNPSQFLTIGKVMWLIVIAQGAALEIYAQWFHPEWPTFTALVKEYSSPLPRAAMIGLLFYHFVIQPIYEGLRAVGIRTF